MYPKFQLKNQILQCIGSGEVTGREIRLSIGYPARKYRPFNTEMAMLKKRGYVKAKGKPLQYSLTVKGMKHLQNPYLYAEMKQRGNRHVTVNQGGVGSGGSGDSSAFQDNTHLLDEIRMKDSEIMKLQAMLRKATEQHLEVSQQLHRSQTPTIIDPIKEQEINKRMERRKVLAARWSKYYLKPDFFYQWGEFYVFMLKGHKKLKPNSCEILSKSNKEHSRGHIDHPLTPQEINECHLHIVEIRDNGIIIESPALSGGRKMLGW